MAVAGGSGDGGTGDGGTAVAVVTLAGPSSSRCVGATMGATRVSVAKGAVVRVGRGAVDDGLG